MSRPLNYETSGTSWFFGDGNDDFDDSNCTIIISRGANSTKILFAFGEGWEGIPFNLIVNSFFFVIFMFTFGILRRIGWNKKVSELSERRKGWLHFIYGDRKAIMKTTLKPRRNEHHQHDIHSSLLLPPPPSEVTHRRGHRRVASEGGQSSVTTKGRGSTKSNLSKSEDRIPEMNVSSQERITSLSKDVENGGRHPSVAEAEDVQSTHRVVDRSLSTDSVTQMGRRLLDVIAIRDEDIQRVKGIDAVQYLIFQRYILCFLGILSAICLLIILPINLQGTIHDSSKPYARTTVSNIEGSSSLLWAHAIISVLMMPIGIILMAHFSRTIKTENEQVARRTLFIRRIPRNKMNKEVLAAFLQSQVPDLVIEGMQLVFNIRQLKKLYIEHRNVVNAIHYCQEYLDKYRQPCEIRPRFLGNCSVCCCCGCCPETDGLTYYREQEEVVEQDLEKEFRETISNPVGSTFITFKTEKMAQSVYKFLRERQEQSFYCLPCLRLWSCVRSLFGPKDEFMTHRWQVSYAPHPEDVNWDDISADSGNIWIRRIVVNFILFIIFFFLTTPPILINTLNYLRVLDRFKSRLSEISPYLTEYFSPLLLVISASILPVFVTFASSYLPNKTISQQNHSTMWKVYLFLLLMVLILPSLGLTSAKALLESVATTEKFRWKCLFPVDNGAFFINYVLQSALLGNAFELIRLPELFIYSYYFFFWTKSPAEVETARQYTLFDFAFGLRYPRFMLIFTMVVAYSISCPLIAPCGFLYMGLKHLVDKYNIYYVYTPSKINDHIHSTAIMFFHIGILMMQFQVFTFSFLRSGYSDVTGISMISVIITIIFFAGQCFFHCFRNINHLTYSAAYRRPTQRLDKIDFCACLYLPPVLRELTEHGIRPDPSTDYGSIRLASNGTSPATSVESQSSQLTTKRTAIFCRVEDFDHATTTFV